MNIEILTSEQAETLLEWYVANARDLPWRHTKDPYRIWVSEIMLQQTRVAAVIDRYQSFLSALPDIQSLALCKADRLNKLWEGIGYYSRVRNMQKCAQVLMDQYHGEFPADAALLQKLPGIGPYTAGAIASFAFTLPVSAIDGNVLRVLARLQKDRSDIRLPQTRNAYADKLDHFIEMSAQNSIGFPSVFNQAIMELGALVCLPGNKAECADCPMHVTCPVHASDLCAEIPYRSKNAERRVICRTLLIIKDSTRFLLHRRKNSGLLAGLYEWIGIDAFITPEQAIEEAERMGLVPLRIHRLEDSRHIFTHLEWHMHAFEIQVAQIDRLQLPDCILASRKELKELAIPSAFHTYTDYYDIR